MGLRKYNPFPIYVWSLILIAFLCGYFVGGVMQAKASKIDMEKACHFFRYHAN